MKKKNLVLLIAIFLFSNSLLAQTVSNRKGDMAASGTIGWFGVKAAHLYADDNNQGTAYPLSGLIGIGGDFEYLYDDDFGIGGLLKFYSTGDDVGKNGAGQTQEESFQSFAVGAFARFHFPNRRLDFSVAPGLALASTEWETETSTSDKEKVGTHLAPFFQLGVMYAVTDQVAAGVETTQFLAWGTEFQGWYLQDYLFKVRFGL